MCYPLPEISHLVSWPRATNLGFSVNHSTFLFYKLPFCVGNIVCSCFQLELRSLELFLKIPVFNRFVTEISHRKLWFDKESFLRTHKGHSTVLNLWGTYLESGSLWVRLSETSFLLWIRVDSFFPPTEPSTHSESSAILILSPCYRRPCCCGIWNRACQMERFL